MLNSFDHFLSRSAKSMKRSAIREILKLLQKPDMISFAGGVPAPETFSVDELKKIAVEVLVNDGGNALKLGLSAFSVYGAKLKGIPLDELGMKPDEIEKGVERLAHVIKDELKEL